MADKDYNYLDEWKAAAKKNKKTTKPRKPRKIWGLKGLASFVSKYKPKTKQNPKTRQGKYQYLCHILKA